MTSQYKIDLRGAVADLDTPCDPPRIYRPNLTQEIHKPMSPETRAKYAFFFDGLDEYLRAPDDIVTSELKDAAKHTHAHLEEYAKVQELRETRSHAVADAYRARNSRIITDMDEARGQLKALRVGDVMNADDRLTERVQRLCSYYNGKDDGKRFKTRHAPSNPSVLQIKRIR